MNHSGIIDMVPAEVRRQWTLNGIYPNKSVYELFHEHARKYPNSPAVASVSETISYAALLDKVRQLAASFRALGIVSGDVIAYQLQNGWHHCAIDLAAAAIGAIVAPFPPGRGRLDIVSLLRRCDARVIIVEDEYAGVDLCGLIESIRPLLLSVRVLVVDGKDRNGWHTMDSLFEPSRLKQTNFPPFPLIRPFAC